MSGQSQLQKDAKLVLSARGVTKPTPRQVVDEMIRIQKGGGGIVSLLKGFAR